MKKLNVLIACEESQTVCKEFRRLGHNAYSCDIQPCSGGHPEWHIKGDCLSAMNLTEHRVFFGEPIPVFYTEDGERHILPYHKWDLIVAHPPCTYLARCGCKYLDENRYGEYAVTRKREKEKAIAFFMAIHDNKCEHIAIENPIGCISNEVRKSDQIIQPWMFGDNVSKSTCLWLKNLPLLVPKVTEKPTIEYVTYTDKKGKLRKIDPFFYSTRFLPKEERRKVRSKTFLGIARAIAEQWSNYIINE